MANHPNRAKREERAVLVTTSHRGVFFGYATDTDGETIKLRAARNCIYWPTDNKGFMGLANMGPVKGERLVNTISVAAINFCYTATKAFEGFDRTVYSVRHPAF